MKINNRLKSLADYIEKDARVMDVGCDHALLDIYLVRHKDIKKCVATDINEGPLKIAKDNIETNCLADYIELRLGNGLDVYSTDLDTVVISGLGGKTMQGIFSQHMESLKTIDSIILSPNNYQADIKKFLCKNGYYIYDETLVKEHRIIYQIISFKKGKRKYNRREYFFGPKLLEKKGSLFEEFYGKEMKSREILLSLLPKSYRLKRLQIKREMAMIRDVLQHSKKG